MAEMAGKELGRRLLDAFRGYVARSMAPVVTRLLELEALVKGIKPEKGDKGEPGEPGAPGKDASIETVRDEVAKAVAAIPKPADGAPGKDAYQLAVAEGFSGSRAQWFDSLRGKDAAPGATGRDALQLDILPAIDEQRSYPRGTYARHANGLWRAVGDTQGMRGWECLVVGVHGIVVDQKEDRRFVLSLSLSTGDKVEKEFVLPVVLDRGVYAPEAKYLRGDGVTFGGSFWIAQVDKPTQKPGVVQPSEQPEWRLSVKKGRDGRDAGKP